MKITITNNKLAPFEKIPEGTIFKDTNFQDIYYIKIASVVDEYTGADEWNCLRLDDYTLDYCSPIFMIYPIPDAELIIP